MRQGDGCETYMILRNGDWLVQLKIVSYEMKDDDVATVDSAVRERCEKEFEKWRLVRTRKNNVFKDAIVVKGLGFKHHGNHPCKWFSLW